MSRIGKKPIEIPAAVSVEIKDGKISAKGPKGILSRDFGDKVEIVLEGQKILVSPKDQSKAARAMWGTARQHLANMILGATADFTKQLQIEGIGYRAAIEGGNLVLNVGFTHPVSIAAEPGISFKVEKNIVSVSGSDKELVAKIAARIRRVRPPEPYKGKGIRYAGEFVRRKVGKKAAAGAK